MQVVDEKSFKILVVTENVTYRNNLGAKLRFEGFNVEFSTGGFHSISYIEKHRDLNLIIIFDNMHDMPAFEIISLARNIRTKADLPIIYISKDKKEEEVYEMVLMGANDFIVHSTNFSPVLDRVKKYFSNLKHT